MLAFNDRDSVAGDEFPFLHLPKAKEDNTQSVIMKQAFYRGWFLCDAILSYVFNFIWVVMLRAK